MAYPTVEGPYGLEPINLVGGIPFAGQIRQFPIASSMPTSIFYGDVVTLTTAGQINRATGTTSATNAIGVFLGCQYTNSSGQLVQAQYYPASTASSNTVAFVQDDPNQLYKVAVCASASTAISGLTQAAVGQNVAIVNNPGSTASGDSRIAVLNSTASTTTLPFRVIAGVPETVNASGSYTEVIVKFNIGVHLYTTSVAAA
jgi:hypothetical protein